MSDATPAAPVKPSAHVPQHATYPALCAHAASPHHAAEPDLTAAYVDDLDRGLNLIKWSVPVKPDGILPLLLKEAIALAHQGECGAHPCLLACLPVLTPACRHLRPSLSQPLCQWLTDKRV